MAKNISPHRVRRGPTAARLEAAVRHYAECGSYVRVAEQLGVHRDTLDRWRKADPDFQAAMDAAGERYDLRLGHLAKQALELQLEAMVARAPLEREAIAQKTGEKVTLREPFQFDVASVRTGLTRLDSRWTHPKKELELSGSVTLEESIAKAAALLDEAPEG